MHHATRHGKGCGRYHDTQVSNEPSPNPDESSLDPGDMQVDEVKSLLLSLRPLYTMIIIIESYFKSCRSDPLWENSDPDRRQV
jgi:hypothetical protein